MKQLKTNKFGLSFLGIFLLSFQNAQASWYENKLEGWYYFEDGKAKEGSLNKELTAEDADEILELKKSELKKLLSLALLVPSDTNVEKYITEQKRWIDQSSEFASTWGRILLQNPMLSGVLETPTTNYGIQLKREYESQRRQAFLSELSQEWFLIYCFNGADYTSERVGEVVLLFQSIHGWKVKGVSLDGIQIDSIKDYEVDKGISHHLGVKAAPAIFMVNPKEKRVLPVGAGLVSVSEIERNIEEQLAEEKDA